MPAPAGGFRVISINRATRGPALAAGLFATPALAAMPEADIDRCILRYRDLIRPATVDIDTIDRFRAVCENIAAGRYRLQTLATGQEIYANQLFQNNIIMWMVVAITLSGVVLAGIQLWATYRLAMAGKGTLADGGEATVEYNKLVVKSSVVGVIILALSFAFFAMYVLYVYQIKDLVGRETITPPPRSTAGAEMVAP